MCTPASRKPRESSTRVAETLLLELDLTAFLGESAWGTAAGQQTVVAPAAMNPVTRAGLSAPHHTDNATAPETLRSAVWGYIGEFRMPIIVSGATHTEDCLHQ